MPAGAREVGGILVDAEGNRILSEAGLPLSKEPLPQAKPIPIKAAPGEIIGYAKDANGNSTPIRAGDLKTVPNAPGTFAVVDMWAEGGPTVVPATKGQPLTAAEVAKMRAEEDRRDRPAPTPPDRQASLSHGRPLRRAFHFSDRRSFVTPYATSSPGRLAECAAATLCASITKELSVFSLKKIALAAGFSLLATTAASPVLAQSTDGFHVIQVFPVVVDSAAFTQRFTFKNPDAAIAATIAITYFPGTGSSQAGGLDCPNVTVPANGQTVVTSLRTLCPALAAGSQFGYVYAVSANAENLLFSGYSRVSNAAGNGFSVEAFPAHTFTSADTIVSGIRRRAASGNAPAFQTNCFIGNVADVTPNLNTNSDLTYTVYSSAGTSLGSGALQLTPGKLTRLLDVFGAANVPAGDYEDASVVFSELGAGEPGLMTYCTVQDNSSFGADFRIGKQLKGWGTQYAGTGQQDDHVGRNSIVGFDIKMTGDTTARAFSIPASATGNTHVVYFRHPDWVMCEIIDPATNVRALPAYGLEMRLRDQYLNTLAGGAGIQGFTRIYLGDKTDRNNGTNARYTIEVESSTVNTTAVRPYKLHCQSGSGHTLGDIVKFNIPAQF